VEAPAATAARATGKCLVLTGFEACVWASDIQVYFYFYLCYNPTTLMYFYTSKQAAVI
jgi:hypothetical protein